MIFLIVGLYLAGLGHYVYENVGAIETLATELRTAGTDVDALVAELTRYTNEHGITPAWEYVYAAEVADLGPSAVFALATVVLPTVFFLVIRRTRRYRGWKPTYLYVLAVLAPIVVLGSNAALGTLPLYVDVLGYVVLPTLAVFALVSRGFIWPRLRRLFG